MKTKKFMTAYLIYALVVGVGLAVWRTILLYRHFDPYNNQFNAAAHSSMELLGTITLAAILLSLTSVVVLRRKEFDVFTASGSQFSVFASSFLGCLCAAGFLLVIFYYPKVIFAGEGSGFHRAMAMLALFLIVFVSIYYIISASARYDGTKAKKALVFFPTLFSVAYLFAVFTDPAFTVGNSNHQFQCVSLSVIVLYFIQEMRTGFYGKSEQFRFPVVLITVISICVYELPNLIVTAFWEMSITYQTMFEFAEVGVLICAVAAARAMIGAVKDRPTEEPKTENTAAEQSVA